MIESTCSEVLIGMDQGKEYGSNPSLDIALQMVCFNETTPPWNPAGPYDPDAGVFETFIDGAGI
jgi:hypothetical protein